MQKGLWLCGLVYDKLHYLSAEWRALSGSAEAEALFLGQGRAGSGPQDCASSRVVAPGNQWGFSVPVRAA